MSFFALHLGGFFISTIILENIMNTVGELISELESFPPETPVVHHSDEEGNTISKVSIGFMTDGDSEPVCVILFPAKKSNLNTKKTANNHQLRKGNGMVR